MLLLNIKYQFLISHNAQYHINIKFKFSLENLLWSFLNIYNFVLATWYSETWILKKYFVWK